nr:DNA helicase [Tanacetum cinerariifolium]
MRLARPDISLEERSLVNSFASWLLDVGDGKIGKPAKEDPENTSWVHVPPAYCLPHDEQDIINSKVLDMVAGESTIYMSQDEATPTRNDGAETEMLYPIEHLNTFNLPGFPPHQLELKVGAPVMLLRNVNIVGGLWMESLLGMITGFSKGVYLFRYDMVRDVIFDICWPAGISAKKEAHLNFLIDPSDGRSTLRLADVLVIGWVGGKHACVDLTGVSPLVGLSSRGFKVGQVALKAASCKVTKHEKTCIDN